MAFFDEPEPAPPPQPSYRMPEWLGPPEHIVPGTVALDAMLVHRPDLAIWVAEARAYPCGLTLLVSLQRREPPDPHAPPMLFGPTQPDDLRFGLLLDDGRKVVAGRLAEQRPLHVRPDQPVLRPRSGSGGGRRSSTELWLWPLPPPGRLTFVCSWPAEGVDEARSAVDAAPILAAAERAVELWPDDRPLPPEEDDVVV